MISPHISCSGIGRLILEIYKSRIGISVLEVTVSFLGKHKEESHIYFFRFSPQPFIYSVQYTGTTAPFLIVIYYSQASGIFITVRKLRLLASNLHCFTLVSFLSFCIIHVLYSIYTIFKAVLYTLHLWTKEC